MQQRTGPREPYVMDVSIPPTVDELAAIEAASAAGKRFAVLPRKCATTEEWLARWAEAGLL
jgi:hypothetical protein